MNILYVSPCGATDLSELLVRHGELIKLIDAKELPNVRTEDYDSFVFDGTGCEKGLLFRPDERLAADRIAESGKPVLCVLCPYILTVCCEPPQRTRFCRPVFTGRTEIEGLIAGDLLDEQCNDRVKCYTSSRNVSPILYYKDNPRGFYRTETDGNIPLSSAALWYESEKVLFCSFGLSNFASARFSPKEKWFSLISYICKNVFGTAVKREEYMSLYTERGYSTVREDGNLDDILSKSVRRAVDWHFDADVILRNSEGVYAMGEGLGAEIRPDGVQVKNTNTTIDSTGESFLMFALDDMYLGTSDKKEYINAFERYSLSHVRNYGGLLDGYGSSGDSGWWNACYGDDVSRGIILPQMLLAFLGKKREGFAKALSCLDFLVGTTGSDGLRFCRTDIIDKKEQTLSLFSLEYGNGKWNWGNGGVRKASELRAIEAKTPSAHYNGYYLATLLLAYKVTGKEVYRATAERGISSIMEKYYPVTAREHSETEELCRMILPLSYLYWVTKQEKHREWLYKVIASLEEKRASDGSFHEWDTGYQACCAGTAGTECSVLAENGNPVVDLLYSLNWLPFSLSQAYFITRDDHIAGLFESLSRFLVSIQIRSANRAIDGAWARAFDTSFGEVYGVPNDVGWAPWSVETGWTMAQIPSGFLLWLMRDRFEKLYE